MKALQKWRLSNVKKLSFIDAYINKNVSTLIEEEREDGLSVSYPALFKKSGEVIC